MADTETKAPQVNFERFQAAGRQHGLQMVRLEMNVAQLLVLVSQVQLALRHPNNKGESAAEATAFVRDVQEQLRALDPVFGEVIEHGFDQALDSDWPSRKGGEPS